MRNTLRDLFPEDISDETAYHLGNFLYELALAFETAYFGQIRRYNKSRANLAKEMRFESSDQGLNVEKEREPF
jgi:hypothetical protein